MPAPASLSTPAASGRELIDLGAELSAAAATGKRGLAVYFGQTDCAYCERFHSVNLADPDIAALIRSYFIWVSLDIQSETLVRTPAGEVLSTRLWAEREQSDFTPSLLFFDTYGRTVLRLRGYYPPYQFRAALDYVSEGFYQREPFATYLARGDDRLVFDETDLNPEPFFSPPPYIFDRRQPAERPLAVFFERGDCHPCDLLHSEIRNRPDLQRRFAQLDTVQLDLRADSPLIAPDGRRLRARAWAAELGIEYAPAIVFFDKKGRELVRVTSVGEFGQLDKMLARLQAGSSAWNTGALRQHP
ncbi:thioredoxin fold domain-containing protein [Caldichromatium japonicum]|uniref:Thioredoxin fold domain-containing protein n=2 Tax=Caldichromatium japonicum TaxID=2699430 RepID=A0A6G7VH13_9GAMM|nr:thioredoxin fold domain-containing protein [Caldichromatium japonicum]